MKTNNSCDEDLLCWYKNINACMNEFDTFMFENKNKVINTFEIEFFCSPQLN